MGERIVRKFGMDDVHTAILKWITNEDLTICFGLLCSVLSGSLGGGNLGRWIQLLIRMAESLLFTLKLSPLLIVDPAMPQYRIKN